MKIFLVGMMENNGETDWKKHLSTIKHKNRGHGGELKVNKVSPEQRLVAEKEVDTSVDDSHSYVMDFDNSAIHHDGKNTTTDTSELLNLSNVAMNLRFDESSTNEATTPPRAPELDKKPLVSEHSPSTKQHMRIATVATSILPVQVAMADKSFINISPTRSKNESEFGNQLIRNATAGKDNNEDCANSNSVNINTKNAIDTNKKGNMDEKVHETIDEWKEALTGDGKIYYYNRRTRESAWNLPPNAKLYQPPVEGREQSFSKSQELFQVKEIPYLFCLYCGVKDTALNIAEHIQNCNYQPANLEYNGKNRLRSLGIIYKCVMEQQQEGETIDLRSSAMKEKVEQCDTCGRTFALGRLNIHIRANVCKTQEKRAAFDSRQKRMNGTAMQFASPGHPPRTPDSRPTSALKSNKKNSCSPTAKAAVIQQHKQEQQQQRLGSTRVE